MKTISEHQIDSANQTDLADYLFSKGIILKKQSNQYFWEDKNVWIHGNKWYSHYDQEGGLAVVFVMKYFDKTLAEAVEELTGEKSVREYTFQKSDETPDLKIPQRYEKTYRVFMYLRNSRCISSDVINAFINMKLLYEDKNHHNCVFVGKDSHGKTGHCHLRSTVSDFKQTVKGSNADYSFHFNGYSDTIYVFEAPIDLLAYISMNYDNWKKHSYVALCSVAERALMYQLKTHPYIKRIILCLDNDEPGQAAVLRITESLREKGYNNVKVEIPKHKDWDEDLQVLSGQYARSEIKEEPQWTESGHSFLSL